ncbi:MAG: hypothetical protein AAFX58_05800 [Pseudomonadota bacterium]
MSTGESGYTPLRYSVKGKRQRFFDARGVDELVAICTNLAQELWLTRERQALLEEALERHAGLDAAALASIELSAERRTALDQERQAFIRTVFFTLQEEAEALGAAPGDEPNLDAAG